MSQDSDFVKTSTTQKNNRLDTVDMLDSQIHTTSLNPQQNLLTKALSRFLQNIMSQDSEVIEASHRMFYRKV